MENLLIYVIQMFASVITYALLIRALLSWFVRDSYSTIGKIYQALSYFTEPLVMPCRKALSRLNTGALDFSVFLTMILVQAIANILCKFIMMIF